MRVLVTGHRGYIGAVLTRLLVQAGHEVHGLDAELFAACDFSPTLLEVPVVAGDLRDVGLGQLAGFDAVVHLAALSDDPLADLDPRLTLDINHRASVRLAGLARAAGVPRLLFASSCAVYGAGGGAAQLDEEAERNPLTTYARSKALVEDRLRALADDAFSPTILRLATVYGVSPRLRLDLALNDLVAQAITTRTIHLRTDGRAWRPLVHVQDAAQAFRAALEAPRERVHGQVINVGSTADNLRIIDLAERVVTAIPGTRLEVATGARPDARDHHVSCERILELLPGWAPRWTVTSGIEELALAFRARGLQAGDFRRYGRLPEIRRRLAAGTLTSDLRRGAPVAAGVESR
jgi:nucleoside-diphosphate-sugar epimerase